MIDLVASENLPRARGIQNSLPVSSLKNFRSPKNPIEARSDCRTKGVLLYSPNYELDEGVFKDLAASGGAFVFSFSDLLSEKGFRRAILISKMRLMLDSCRRAGCGFVACTLAKDENGTRSARELSAFMSVLGMNQHEKEHAKKTADRLAGI